VRFTPPFCGPPFVSVTVHVLDYALRLLPFRHTFSLVGGLVQDSRFCLLHLVPRRSSFSVACMRTFTPWFHCLSHCMPASRIHTCGKVPLMDTGSFTRYKVLPSATPFAILSLHADCGWTFSSGTSLPGPLAHFASHRTVHTAGRFVSYTRTYCWDTSYVPLSFPQMLVHLQRTFHSLSAPYFLTHLPSHDTSFGHWTSFGLLYT